MVLVLQVIQVITGVSLVGLILMHAPKGGGLGSIGGAAQLFSSQKSAESGLNRLTHGIAGVFLVVSFIIGIGLIK